MRNALTIDVEDWYQTMDFNFSPNTWAGYESRIQYSLHEVTELLNLYDIKATFFVLGDIAKRYPALIRKLSEDGHEIGSHGSTHRLVYKQSPDEFMKDICDSKNLLEDITGRKVTLFRASSWSISRETLWALGLLEEAGYTCDSSIQPFKTPLSGMNRVPKEPFYPIIKNKKMNILEFPISVFQIGKAAIPFAGGLYLRVLPVKFVEYALKRINKEREGMIYVHPWEVDHMQPRLDVQPHIKFTHYYHLNKTKEKLGYLFNDFEFVKLEEIIKDKQFPYLTID